jgi:hypothetical protein
VIVGKLVVGRINFHENRPGLDSLIILYVELDHMAGNSRADRVDMTIDLGIIGRFIAGHVAVNEKTHHKQNDDSDHHANAEAGALRTGRPRVKISLTRRQGFGTRRRLLLLDGRALRRLFHTLSNAFQKSFDALFGSTDGIRQFDFRQIVSVETLNVTLVRTGDRFLRLDDFEVVSHASTETVL